MSVIRSSFAQILRLRLVTAAFLLSLVVVMVLLGRWALLAGLMFAFFLCVYEILELPNKMAQGKLFKPKVIAYIIFSFGCGAYILFKHQYLFVLMCACVWIYDASAFAFGSWLKGPHPWPRISPNKTYAGLIGGTITVMTLFYAFTSITLLEQTVEPLMHLTTISHEPLWLYLLTPLLLSFFAQAGDLVFSYVKRKSNISNFSGLLPGHGGTLDRLDSMMGGWICGLIIYEVGGLF